MQEMELRGERKMQIERKKRNFKKSKTDTIRL